MNDFADNEIGENKVINYFSFTIDGPANKMREYDTLKKGKGCTKHELSLFSFSSYFENTINTLSLSFPDVLSVFCKINQKKSR